jgi:hypothetical protein
MSFLAAASPIVDWGKLGQVVLYSLIAGIGVMICFSLAVVGATRFAELRRSGGGGSFAYGALAAIGLTATVAAAVLAIVVMTSKS